MATDGAKLMVKRNCPFFIERNTTGSRLFPRIQEIAPGVFEVIFPALGESLFVAG